MREVYLKYDVMSSIRSCQQNKELDLDQNRKNALTPQIELTSAIALKIS